jgi:hypothetical protein
MKARAPRNPNGSIRSRTCTDPHLLDSTVRRWLGWYDRHYDPKRTTLSSEIMAARTRRDEQDRKRISPHLKVKGKALARLILRDSRFSRKQKRLIVHNGFIYRFAYWMKHYRGRMHCSLLEQLAGGRRQWGLIRNLLLNKIIRILDEYDQDQHKCRQWGLVSSLLGDHRSRDKKKRNVDVHDWAVLVVGPFLDAQESLNQDLIRLVNGQNDEMMALGEVN